MSATVNYIVGPPGTGKTTTIARLVEQTVAKGGKTKGIICSLTRAAAAEAAGRVDLPEDRVGTLHSFAYRALGGKDKVRLVETDGPSIKAWNEHYPYWPLARVSGSTDDAPEDQQGGHAQLDQAFKGKKGLGTKLLEAYGLCRSQLGEVEPLRPEIPAFIQAWEVFKRQQHGLDFTDLLDRAMAEPLCPGNPRVAYFDEAQDFSRLGMRLIRHWAEHMETIYMVGDPYQNLYEWAGSDYYAAFPEHMPPLDTYVLSQSYRVPHAVHRQAMRTIERHGDYREFAYAPRPAEGTVERAHANLAQPRALVGLIEQQLETYETVMVMAPCAYMLDDLIDWLRALGMPFHNPWRLSNGAWNPLTRVHGRPDRLRCLLARGDTSYWAPHEAQTFLTPLRAEGVFQPGQKGRLKTSFPDDLPWTQVQETLRTLLLPEAYDALTRLDDARLVAWWCERIGASKDRDRAEYATKVYKNYGKEGLTARPRLSLGTAHSFKGAESDCTMLGLDLSRAGWEGWAAGQTRDQIRRMLYVMKTRAKHHMVLLEPASELHLQGE